MHADLISSGNREAERSAESERNNKNDSLELPFCKPF